MNHRYDDLQEMSGTWLSTSGRVYCRWQWNSAARELTVDHADDVYRWGAPELDCSLDTGIQLDLAETARDVARQMQRDCLLHKVG